MATTITMRFDDAQEFQLKKLKELLNEKVYTKALLRAMDMVLIYNPRLKKEVEELQDKNLELAQHLRNLLGNISEVRNAELELAEQIQHSKEFLTKR